MKKIFQLTVVVFFLFSLQSAFAQALQDFLLVNKTKVIIDKVFISPNHVDEWGEDILGVDVLENDQECKVSFHPKEDVCYWDLRIEDSDGNAIIWEAIDLCKWAKITLFWDGEKATAEFE
jgi:hypothetical protein